MCVQTVSMFLLWSQAEQGPTEGQDWLLGPEGILGHLQPVRPMTMQVAETRGGAVFMFLQLSESVLQLSEHVEPKNTNFEHYKLLQTGTEEKKSPRQRRELMIPGTNLTIYSYPLW